MAISIPISWSRPQRLIFRFLFAYCGLFMLSNQSVVSGWIMPLWERLLMMVAPLLGFDLDTSVTESGSGDGLFNYLMVATLLSVSVLIAALWSLLDHRTAYGRLLQFLVVALRYYLVFQMLVYGFAKVGYAQFPAPGYHRLIQPIGDASPMGLLWTFMGFSYGYNLFTGGAELLGGLLLLFRRTTTLGALVTFGVMANVMALNFFYDVPVKLLSTHLVLFSLLLLLLDGKRLLQLFFFNKSTQAVPLPDLFDHRWYKTGKIILKAIILIAPAALLFTLTRRSDSGRQSSAHLQGLYQTEIVVENGDTLAHPSLSEKAGWPYWALEPDGRLAIQWEGRNTSFYHIESDSVSRQIIFPDEAPLDTVRYEMQENARVWFNTVRGKDTLSWCASRRQRKDFLLNNRGFRFINETPYNR